MKQILTLTAVLLLAFTSKINATNFVFSGNGNWNTSSNWSPAKPVPQSNMNSFDDTITINGTCEINQNDSVYLITNAFLKINGSLTNNGNVNWMGGVIVSSNGAFINNNIFYLQSRYLAGDGSPLNFLENNGMLNNLGVLNLETHFFSFTNNGTINNQNVITNIGNFINNTLLNNFGTIETNSSFSYFNFDSAKIIYQTVNADISNLGTINNYKEIYADGYVLNNSDLNSYSGTVNGVGHTFYNNDTIVGKLYCAGIQNNGILSPGIGAFDTDTMFFEYYGIAGKGTILMDINNTNDNDVIQFSYGQNIGTVLDNMVIYINPNFTPSINDTFDLVRVLNVGPSPFKQIRNSLSLPSAPNGYVWKILQSATGIKLALDFALPLPPENLKFLAVKNINSVDLNWEVTIIENVVRFEVEHSVTGMNFERIGIVNVASDLKFTYKDNKPNEGANYYRLKAIDQDGKYMYSYIELVNFSKTENEVLNTIVENVLNVHLANSQQINIVDLSGKLVYSSILSGGNQTISLSHLTKGIYFLQTENGKYKFIKL